MPSFARKIVFDTAKAKARPYCNRNFIQIVEIDEKSEENGREGKKKERKEKEKQYKNSFKLDHFLDKDSCPTFAVSLYNLISVCPSCNRVKSIQNFDYYPYSFTNRSDDLKFNYIIKGVDFLKDESLIEIDLGNRSPEIAKSIDGLYLKKLYESHKNLVQKIAGKVRFFVADYRKSVFSSRSCIQMRKRHTGFCMETIIRRCFFQRVLWLSLPEISMRIHQEVLAWYIGVIK